MVGDIAIVNALNKKLGLVEIKVEEDERPPEFDERDFWDIEDIQDVKEPDMADIKTRARTPVSIASQGSGGK